MVWALLGIVLGLIIGFTSNISIPIEFTKYSAVVIMGLLDALFGAIRAETMKDRFSVLIFTSGLLFNILLSVFITILGEKLGLDLYLAAAFVFTFRIFNNVGMTRRFIIENTFGKAKK